jgi:histidinol dehydrogenase
MPVQRADWNTLDDASQRSFLRRPAVDDDAAIREAVLGIVADVRNGGDDALRTLTARLDGVELADLRVSREEIDAASASLSPEAIEAIDVAIANVRCFHEAQRSPDIAVETMPGVRCERVSRAIGAVGLYVPAGTAPLPSAAVMLAVPAAIAGCATRIVCTPPRPDGQADPAVVVAAARAGVSDIVKIGGAQAIAAMAYGTPSVPKVDKIFGPGNAWVTCAKSVVSSDPDGAAIDMPAGPSEVLVIADESASAEFVASDLLSQAEHGVDSQVVLVTTSGRLADAVEEQVEQQLRLLSRAEIARGSLQHARVLIVDDLDMAVEVSNCRLGLRRTMDARIGRRLLQRHQSRASDLWLCPQLQRTEPGPIHARHDRAGIDSRRTHRLVRDRDHAGRSRGAGRPCRGRDAATASRIMTIAGLVRADLRALQPYEAAQQVDDTIRLNANEAPWSNTADRFRRPLNRYPEIRPGNLARQLGEYFACDPSRLLVTRWCRGRHNARSRRARRETSRSTWMRCSRPAMSERG